MRRSRRNKDMTDAIVEDTVETTTGLPPRSNRLAKRQKARKMKFFLVGLYLFGTIAIGFIGFELFQASRNMPTVQYQAEKETTIARVNQAASSQAKNTTSIQPPTAQEKPNATTPTATAYAQQQAPIQKPAVVQNPVSKPATNTTQTKQPPTQQANKPKLKRHRVAAGDTLFKLSRKYYGNGMGVDRIARQNHLNPEAPLPIGRVIYIPLR